MPKFFASLEFETVDAAKFFADPHGKQKKEVLTESFEFEAPNLIAAATIINAYCAGIERFGGARPTITDITAYRRKGTKYEVLK